MCIGGLSASWLEQSELTPEKRTLTLHPEEITSHVYNMSCDRGMMRLSFLVNVHPVRERLKDAAGCRDMETVQRSQSGPLGLQQANTASICTEPAQQT